MTDELLAYLLDDLCPERRGELERRLAEEPALRRELARLEECLATSGEPAACLDEPPRDLLKRTCGLVERVGDSGVMALPAAGLPGAALSACEATSGVGSRWSLADCVVGVGVIGVLGMLMLPAMRESRDAARRRVCADNLRALGTAVFDYTTVQRHSLPPRRAGEPLGMYAVELVDRGGLNPEDLAQRSTCPDSEAAKARFDGKLAPRIPSGQQLTSDNGRYWEQLLALTASTAVRSGQFAGNGRYRCAKFSGRCGQPEFSDAPAVTPHGIYIVVHEGLGHNVVDESVNVKFVCGLQTSPEHERLYENNAGEAAAGSDPSDVVLIGGNRCPDGKSHFPIGRVVSLREGQ